MPQTVVSKVGELASVPSQRQCRNGPPYGSIVMSQSGLPVPVHMPLGPLAHVGGVDDVRVGQTADVAVAGAAARRRAATRSWCRRAAQDRRTCSGSQGRSVGRTCGSDPPNRVRRSGRSSPDRRGHPNAAHELAVIARLGVRVDEVVRASLGHPLVGGHLGQRRRGRGEKTEGEETAGEVHAQLPPLLRVSRAHRGWRSDLTRPSEFPRRDSSPTVRAGTTRPARLLA